MSITNTSVITVALAIGLITPGLVIASSLPHMDLNDVEGHEVAKAEIHVHGRQWDIMVKPEAAQTGRYRFILARGDPKGDRCSTLQSAQTIAEGPSFQLTAGNEVNSALEIPSAEDAKDIKRMMTKREVMLALFPEGAAVPAACGKVFRWYSPWRDARQ